MAPVFELKNVALGYGGETVLEVDAFEFERGGIYALLGPNGSGKTTLLRTLCGLMKPIRGRVLMDGKDIYQGRETAPVGVRRRVTLVTQSPVLFDASLAYNAAYAPRARGVPPAAAAELAEDAVRRVGLSHLLHRNARNLSGGEAQRAAIARALAARPEVLLLDEPTGNVDVENTGIIEEIIRGAAAGSGTTVILSTHSGRQARRLANLAVHLFEGRLKLESPDRPAGYLWNHSDES